MKVVLIIPHESCTDHTVCGRRESYHGAVRTFRIFDFLRRMNCRRSERDRFLLRTEFGICHLLRAMVKTNPDAETELHIAFRRAILPVPHDQHAERMQAAV